MILIADCGATSINWGYIKENGSVGFRNSGGINFSLIHPEEFTTKLTESVPNIFLDKPIEKIWFYAAGCRTQEHRTGIKSALNKIFNHADIQVDDDLLAAARAVCGSSEGIACILGTGSNSCLYNPADGGKIVKSIPPLGYILGDEGSGTFIGKKIISDALKGLLSKKLTDKFYEFAGADKDEILSRVYTGKASNNYIANFSKFAKSNFQYPEIHNLIYSAFDIFIKRNVLQLMPKKPLPVGFVGSIADAFQPILSKVVEDHRLELSVVLQSPIEALVNFHINNIN